MAASLISNPPYNMKWTHPDLAGFMPQYQGWMLPPESNANYAFILSGLQMIDDKAVFLLPNGVMTSNTKEEQILRKQLIEDNLISAVIALPDSMFESTGIPVCLIIFDRHKQTTKIEMIDMRQCYETEIRDQNGQYGGNSHTGRTYHKEVKIITEAEMLRAIDAINNLSNIPGYCKAILPEMVKAQDFVLAPGRYIEQETVEEHHRSFADIAADYNRIISYKNQIQVKMNKTAAKRLGYDCMDKDNPDLIESFALVGETALKENFISFSADDGITIKCSTKNTIPDLIIMFLGHWKQYLMYLNNEENRYLAEFRDALLPELMSGKINIGEERRDIANE